MVPLHPLTVHFPVALLISSLIFAILSLIVKSKENMFIQLFKWNLFLGALASLVAVITGLIEETGLVHNETIHELLELHKIFGFIIAGVAVILSVWFIIRNSKLRGTELKVMILILAITVGTLGYSAHLGGKMVYENGAGVAPMEDLLSDDEHDHSTHEHNESDQQEGENENHDHSTHEHNESDQHDDDNHDH